MSTHLPTHLLYQAHTGALPPAGPCVCWLCGAPCPPADPTEPISRDAADVVRSTFNDHARARRGGDSQTCCHACAWYFDHKIERPGAKRAMGFFTKTIISTPAEWREWDREQMAADLLGWHRDGLPEPMLITCNFSKQKHVVPWARVNPAGIRRPWVETDIGQVRIPAGLPVLVCAVAELWSAGYGKTLLADAQLSPFILAQSPQPARDLALAALLAPHVGTPTLPLITYIVTEENRERLARELAPALPRHVPVPAEGGAARPDPERGRRPVIQKPVRPPVVGDARGTREARRHHEPRPDPVEQLGLL